MLNAAFKYCLIVLFVCLSGLNLIHCENAAISAQYPLFFPHLCFFCSVKKENIIVRGRNIQRIRQRHTGADSEIFIRQTQSQIHTTEMNDERQGKMM